MPQVFLWIHRLSAIAKVVFTNEFFFLIFRNNSCGENYHNKISTIHLKKETVRCNYFNCFYSIRACYIITMKLFLNQTENFLHFIFSYRERYTSLAPERDRRDENCHVSVVFRLNSNTSLGNFTVNLIFLCNYYQTEWIIFMNLNST